MFIRLFKNLNKSYKLDIPPHIHLENGSNYYLKQKTKQKNTLLASLDYKECGCVSGANCRVTNNYDRSDCK